MKINFSGSNLVRRKAAHELIAIYLAKEVTIKTKKQKGTKNDQKLRAFFIKNFDPGNSGLNLFILLRRYLFPEIHTLIEINPKLDVCIKSGGFFTKRNPLYTAEVLHNLPIIKQQLQPLIEQLIRESRDRILVEITCEIKRVYTTKAVGRKVCRT